MTKKKNRLVKIFWDDAVVYARPLNRNFKLQKKITEGELFKENSDFIVVKNPITFDFDNVKKQYIPFALNKKMTFFFIPKGMVKKIVKN